MFWLSKKFIRERCRQVGKFYFLFHDQVAELRSSEILASTFSQNLWNSLQGVQNRRLNVSQDPKRILLLPKSSNEDHIYGVSQIFMPVLRMQDKNFDHFTHVSHSIRYNFLQFLLSFQPLDWHEGITVELHRADLVWILIDFFHLEENIAQLLSL